MRNLPLFFAAFLFSFPVFAQNWTIDASKSTVGFEGSQMGAPFTGSFAAPAGTIIFDPAKLEESSAVIEIDIASVKTGSEDRDGNILKSAWFDAAKFPKAVFKSTKFEKKAERDGIYSVTGDLTIRDVTLPVIMPFTFKTEGERATAEGSFEIGRLDYGIGQGEWKDTSMVGGKIAVKVAITATKAP